MGSCVSHDTKPELRRVLTGRAVAGANVLIIRHVAGLTPQRSRFRRDNCMTKMTERNAMNEKTIENLKESVALSGTMLDLAERGVGGCQDDGCLVVYGIIRDCAYKIRTSAEHELKEHQRLLPSV
jgi:hypothetical protein